ncbi:hypothetical protein Tco_1501297, partial [Tanacetum coccineum]
GLSVMASKLGNPIMLDSYTSSMCLESWGHTDYDHALIDIRVDRELKEDMVIAIPNVKDDGEVLQTVRVEYEWEPPRYGVCMLGSNGGSSNSGKLMLLDEDGKPLKAYKPTLPNFSNVVSKKVDDMVNEDSDSEVKEVYDETATYMASTSSNVNKPSKSGSGGTKSLYEQWKKIHGEDPYSDDNFDDPGLTDAQMKFANAFEINLRGQLR